MISLESIKEERDDLAIKIESLSTFIAGYEFNAQSPEDQADILSQKFHMMNYLDTLNSQINRNLAR